MNLLPLFFSLCALALLLWTFARPADSSWRLWFLRCMLFGMCYDNVVVGVGNWCIDEDWYLPFNVPRYFLHASVLPFLTLFGLSIMRAAGVKAAKGRFLTNFCFVFTACALGWGLYHEVYLLELAPTSVMGMMKLKSVSSLPPIATILTNVLVLPMAAAVWKTSGWKWFFLGSVFIFLLNGSTGGQPWGFLAGNAAELIFMLCLLATHRKFRIGM